MRLQQGFAASGMGFKGQFAWQEAQAAHVRFGSLADIADALPNVRFTPNSGHHRPDSSCPLSAKSGHSSGLIDYFIGAA
jgi:hypothetical protein